MTEPAIADDPVFKTDVVELEPVLKDLRDIALMKDGALRNLFITQRYHDVSQKMTVVLGSTDLNWCTFAAWASKTAGESIRGDEVPDFARKLLAREGWIEMILARIKGFFGFADPNPDIELFDDVRGVLDGVSEQIAEGNLKVYAEIAPLFSRYVVQLGTTPTLDETAWAEFAQVLRLGSPDEDGQDLLRVAFRHYYEARFVADAAERAQKILFANVLTGLHEQTRLQSAIKGAMDVPAEEGLDEILERSARRRLPRKAHAQIPAKVRKLSPLLKKVIIEGWERIATRVAMRLALPRGKSIHLGRDVPLVAGQMFPDALVAINYQPLRQLMEQYGAHPNSTVGSGADDWSELPQRMKFIFNLFRANQQNQELYDEPFNKGQRDDFNAHRMPRDQTEL